MASFGRSALAAAAIDGDRTRPAVDVTGVVLNRAGCGGRLG